MVGLTRRGHSGGSLLKQINGVRANGPASNSTRHTSKNLTPAELKQTTEDLKHGTKVRISLLDTDEQKEDIYREPDSSGDEGESAVILPTVWTGGSSGQYDTDDDGFGPIRGQRVSKTRDRARVGSTPLRRSIRRGNETTSSSKEIEVDMKTVPSPRLETTFGFPLQQNRKRNLATYGSQPKRRAVTTSQGKVAASPPAKFKQPRKLAETPDPETPEEKFKARNVNDLLKSPPVKAPQFRSGLVLSPSTTDGSEAPVLQSSDDELSSVAETPEMEEYPHQKDEDQSQMDVFRMPVNFSIEGDSVELSEGEDISLEQNGHNATDISSDDLLALSPEVTRISTCPMCGEAVEPDHLQAFSKGNTMNIRSQAKFCRAHKRKTARNEWTQKHYPTIDWSSFDARISAQYTFLDSLLNGASCPSRDILQENVRLGKDRTLLQAMGSGSLPPSPGYYGTRGLRAISESIMQKFSPQLRRIAVTDRLVAARGVSGYVQSVLVPELAVRLIAEDMGVGDEEARVVMRESVVVGELLNEEVEDVVYWSGEEGEEGTVD